MLVWPTIEDHYSPCGGLLLGLNKCHSLSNKVKCYGGGLTNSIFVLTIDKFFEYQNGWPKNCYGNG